MAEDEQSAYESALHAFVADADFPCVGAKSALARGEISCLVLDDITRPVEDIELRAGLCKFVEQLKRDGPLVQSFAAVFAGPDDLSESNFETALWNRLQCLHNLDTVAGAPWAHDTSSDPDSHHFSVSFCGEAFFVIGLHPNSSRPARRFKFPTLIFNSHEQFERLRVDGRFDTMKQIIRKNEVKVTGSINPMLNDYGDASEAPQYSGREVGADWACPFRSKVQTE